MSTQLLSQITSSFGRNTKFNKLLNHIQSNLEIYVQISHICCTNCWNLYIHTMAGRGQIHTALAIRQENTKQGFCVLIEYST